MRTVAFSAEQKTHIKIEIRKNFYLEKYYVKIFTDKILLFISVFSVLR